MGPVQKLERMSAAVTFAELKLKAIAKAFKNSTQKLNILALMLSFKYLTNLIEQF